MLTLSHPTGSAPGAAVQLFEKYQFPDKSMICLIYSQPFCLNLFKNLIFRVGSHSVFDTAKARRSIVQRAQHLNYTANCFSRQDKRMQPTHFLWISQILGPYLVQYSILSFDILVL